MISAYLITAFFCAPIYYVEDTQPDSLEHDETVDDWRMRFDELWSRYKSGKEIPDGLTIKKVGKYSTLEKVEWRKFAGGRQIDSPVDFWIYVDKANVSYYSFLTIGQWQRTTHDDRSTSILGAINHYWLVASRTLIAGVVVSDDEPLPDLAKLAVKLKNRCEFQLYQGTLEVED